MKKIIKSIVTGIVSEQYERMVTLFPVLVVLLASIAFIFGGRCAQWQWWVAMVVSIGIAGRDGLWRRTAMAGILFVLYLAVIWVLCRINWVGCWNDYQEYHMPAVRMLIAGWNPLHEATLEHIASSLSVDPATFRPWHVLSMCKSAWYYNAVAYFFMREPYNIMSPVYYALLPAVVLQLWKAMREVSRVVRVTMIVLLVSYCPGPFMAVDAIVALAGIGLLLSFREILATGRWRWEMLVAFSFWLLTVKQMAGICCVLFWFGFMIIMVCLKREFFKSCFLISLIVGAMSVLTTLSPYYTSWSNYGHPLYPCYSSDKERYPIVDIVEDFLYRNDDAAAMGHLGAAVNAYVSTALAKVYYAWKFEKPDFSPCAQIWEWHHGKGCSSPTDSRLKFFLCLSVCLCLALGDRWTRMLSLIVILGMLAVPTQMLGYERYVPWWMILPIFSVFSIAQIKSTFNIQFYAIALLGGVLSALWLFGHSFVWEASYLNRMYLAHRLPKEVFSYYKPCMLGAKTRVGIHGDIYRIGRCNVDLLKRQCSDFRNTVVKEIDPNGLSMEELSSYPTLAWDSLMRLPKGEDVWWKSEYQAIQREPSRMRRLLRYPVFAIKSWTITLFKLIVMRSSLT